MFNSTGDDVPAFISVCECHAFNGQVVGFGPSACKDNPAGLCIDQLANLAACLFYSFFGLFARTVDA